MKRDINDLNKIASEIAGEEVEFLESIELSGDEIADVIGSHPGTDMIVHSSTLSNENTVMLVTTGSPEYDPWVLLIQNKKYENITEHFFE